MKRIISIAISCLLIASLVGCAGSAEDAESGSVVYSMSGSNDLFEISNGVIVLGEEEEVFDGGDLKILQEDLFSDVTAYTCSYLYSRQIPRRKLVAISFIISCSPTGNVPMSIFPADCVGIIAWWSVTFLLLQICCV